MGGDGPLVAVGVGDTGEAVAVEMVGGLGYGGGSGGYCLGVDGVAVGDVEVDEAAGGRVSGGRAPSISTSAWPMPPWGMGIRTRV